jgi:8-oxo-dGTP diphosphatase
LEKKEELRFEGQPGLPGMLIFPNENTSSAIESLSKATVGFENYYRRQLRAFTEVARHPQGRVITIGYYGLVPYEKVQEVNDRLFWNPINSIPDLCYDHNRIIPVALEKFRNEIIHNPIVFELLPKHFILREVIDVYEQLFNKELDAANFRRQMKTSGLISPVGKIRDVKHQIGRKPEEYQFNSELYHSQKQKEKVGFTFTASS